jgi:hypothetical protein
VLLISQVTFEQVQGMQGGDGDTGDGRCDHGNPDRFSRAKQRAGRNAVIRLDRSSRRAGPAVYAAIKA